jgi:hypothetical protein
MAAANQLPCTWCQDYYYFRQSTAKIFKELFCSDKCEDKYELAEELKRTNHAKIRRSSI